MRQHTLGISRQSDGKMAIVNEEKIICALDNRSKKKKKENPLYSRHTHCQLKMFFIKKRWTHSQAATGLDI